MFCSNCRAELKKDFKFCQNCGQEKIALKERGLNETPLISNEDLFDKKEKCFSYEEKALKRFNEEKNKWLEINEAVFDGRPGLEINYEIEEIFYSRKKIVA